MLRIAVVLFACLSLNACSISYANKKKISDNEYLVQVNGNGFTRQSELLEKLNKNAEELCGVNSFTIDNNFKVVNERAVAGGVAHSVGKGVLEAKVTCKK